MSKPKFNLFIISLVILYSPFLILNTSYAFTITVDNVSQRTDGSQYFDIYYSLEGVHDCVEIGLKPVTASGETLTCESFIEPSDTGTICSDGSYHIIWNLGHDVPGREFFNDKVAIEMWAAKPGIVPGDCGCGVCVDIDANSYETIQICDQCWMAENLKVTHYRDGSPIPHVTDPDVWDTLTTGAYCEYNNDITNVGTYGRLYNWYAVNDPRGLAPVGWHVPTDDEYKILEICLGMDSTEANSTGYRGTDQGSQLAGRADLWLDGALGSDPAFGTSGFTALPAGYRYLAGYFLAMSSYAIFWSSSEFSTGDAWLRYLNYSTTEVYRGYSSRGSGFSVRCVRD